MTISGESDAARKFAEYAVEAVRRYTPDDSGIGLEKMLGMNFDLAVREAVLAERERCESTVRAYLVFESQRAVSWHEAQDCLERIRLGAAAEFPWKEKA